MPSVSTPRAMNPGTSETDAHLIRPCASFRACAASAGSPLRRCRAHVHRHSHGTKDTRRSSHMTVPLECRTTKPNQGSSSAMACAPHCIPAFCTCARNQIAGGKDATSPILVHQIPNSSRSTETSLRVNSGASEASRCDVSGQSNERRIS